MRTGPAPPAIALSLRYARLVVVLHSCVHPIRVRSRREAGRLTSRSIPGELLPGEWWLLLYLGFSYVIWAKVFGDYPYFVSSEVLAPAIVALTVCQIVPCPAIPSRWCHWPQWLRRSLRPWYRGGTWPWDTRTYFDVGLPPHTTDKDTLVVIRGYQPLAFVIPFFDGLTQFVRVQSDFTNLQSAKYDELLSQTIADHQGPFALLTSIDALAGAEALIRKYGLAMVAGGCEGVPSVSVTRPGGGLETISSLRPSKVVWSPPQILLCRLARRSRISLLDC